jgi:intracellular septation protein A
VTHPPALEIPKLWAIAVHATPRIVEGTLVPLGLFFVTYRLLGIWAALAAGLAWTYGAIGVRLVKRTRVPGVLLIGALTTTARLALALATDSVFLYFLQPTLGTALVGAAFLLSFAARRPLAARLAHDFCPLPDSFTGHPHVRRFFLNISLLWAAVFLANAALTWWLLLSQSIGFFVLAKPFVSFGLTGAGIVCSTLWFHRSMRSQGLLRRRGAAVVVAG